MRLVLIEWEDSQGASPRWQFLEPDAKPPPLALCRSVGWLYHDGKDRKVVVPHLIGASGGDAEQGCGDMTIPASSIRKIVTLRTAKK